MTVFSFLILSGQGLGAVIFGKHRYELVKVDTYCGEIGWVEMSLGFRWIAWSAYSFSWTEVVCPYNQSSQHDDQWRDDHWCLLPAHRNPRIQDTRRSRPTTYLADRCVAYCRHLRQ
jgi:hypothetical protein